MVAGEPLGLFRVGRGGETGSVGDRVGLCRGRPGPAAVPSADDDEDSGLWLLRGGIFLAPDPEAFGGRRRFSGVGGGEPAGLPHHIGFSEASSEGAGRAIPAGVTNHIGDGNDEAGPRGAARQQGEGQREQAQGDELWTDARDREAAAGGSPELAEPSRSSRCGRGYPLWAGSAWG